jgi:EpsI family protein
MRSKTARLVIAIVMIASTAALARGARAPHGIRAVDLDGFPYRIAAWAGRDAEPLDEETLRILSADSYLNRNYNVASAGLAPINLYVAYYQQQRPGVSIHSPLHCLPGTGWEPLDVSTIDLPETAGGGQARQLVVRRNRDRALVLYWYAIHGRLLANEVFSKAWLLHDSLRFGRSDAALVRIVVPLPAGTDVDSAQHRGLDFARGALPYLQRLWS